MIRYPFDWAELEEGVDARCADWRRDARSVTAALIAGAPLPVAPPSWSDVKPVFMEMQSFKCCYCETGLERDPKAGIQFDVEHFRPKKMVRAWQGPSDLPGAPWGGASADGYRFLAYDLHNYAASCKTCNTILKRCYFPIAGARRPDAVSMADALDEQTLLIYPVGKETDVQEDPQQHISFFGPIAIPRDGSIRGRAIIALFDLNRDGLKFARCERLVLAWEAVDPELYAASGAPHSACVARFLALRNEDAIAARRHYDSAVAWVRREYGHTVS